jgi:glycosyltransferase involved in cell wall biosynthesis
MSPKSARPRVLVIAEAANPEWVSVPLVGWCLAEALTRVADVHVVTQVRNREAILKTGWQEGREFTCIDSEPIAKPVYVVREAVRKLTGAGWTAATAIASITYPYFEHLLWRRFEPQLRAGDFDLVHRVTPLSPTTPSIIAARLKRIGVPFMWGPINGGVPWPDAFGHVLRQEGEWLSYVRGAHKLMPGYRATRRDAAAILVGSRDTWGQLEGHHDRCVYLPENAIDPARFQARADQAGPLPLRLAFVGRLVPYKGCDLVLDAAAGLLRTGQATLDIIGDGPELQRLKDKVAALGVGAAVRLEGWVAHTEMAARLARSQVLAFPSIREFGGGVVLEAMACGLVPVVVDYAGPAEHVTPETGHAIPLGSPAEITARLKVVLESLVADPARRARLAAASLERVERLYTWQARAEQVAEVYRWVLAGSPPAGKPDFGMPLGAPRAGG